MSKAHHELARPLKGVALAMLCCSSLVAACNDQAGDNVRSNSKGWEDLPELQIVRAEAPSNEAEAPSAPVIDKNGMTTVAVHVPPTFLLGGGVGDNTDQTNLGAQEILERAGVTFPLGAYARYEAFSSQLTVYNTPEQIELVEAYTQPIGQGPSKLLTCRVEIYEMSTQAAAKLQRIAAQKVFHEAERKAVIAACRQGDATFVTGVDLPALSGQRARFESGKEYPLISAFQAPVETESKPSQPNALLEWRRSGLVLEIEPITNADQFSIDLNLRLNFGIAPVRDDSLQLIAEAGNDDAAPISVRRFSHFELETQVHLFDGVPSLIGTFPLPPTLTDKDQDALPAQSQVVFVQLFIRSR